MNMEQRRSDDGNWRATRVIVPYVPALTAEMLRGTEVPDVPLISAGRRDQIDLVWRGVGWPSIEDVAIGVDLVRTYWHRQPDDINLIVKWPSKGDMLFGVRVA